MPREITPPGAGDGDRRRDILDAALEAFDTWGYEATTIAHIRERSGASTGSIYHHFGDKAGIAATLYQEALAHYRQGMLARAQRARGARSLVRGIVIYHLEWAAEHPVQARYLLRHRHSEGVATREQAVREGTQAFLRQMHTHLARHVERGDIVRLPSSLYPLVLLGPAQDMLRHWLRGELPLDPRRVAHTLADMAWKALRPARRAQRR